MLLSQREVGGGTHVDHGGGRFQRRVRVGIDPADLDRIDDTRCRPDVSRVIGIEYATGLGLDFVPNLPVLHRTPTAVKQKTL